jgi:hypothetical protein
MDIYYDISQHIIEFIEIDQLNNLLLTNRFWFDCVTTNPIFINLKKCIEGNNISAEKCLLYGNYKIIKWYSQKYEFNFGIDIIIKIVHYIDINKIDLFYNLILSKINCYPYCEFFNNVIESLDVHKLEYLWKKIPPKSSYDLNNTTIGALISTYTTFEKLIISDNIEKAKWFYIKCKEILIRSSNKSRLMILFTYICSFCHLKTIKFLYKIIPEKKSWHREIIYLGSVSDFDKLSFYDKYVFFEAILLRSKMNSTCVYEWVSKKISS